MKSKDRAGCEHHRSQGHGALERCPGTSAGKQQELRVWGDARNDPWQTTENHYAKKDITSATPPASV